MLAFEASTFFTGIAALASAVGGIFAVWWAIKKAQREGERGCLDDLHAARAEAEQYTGEVHRWRMAFPEQAEEFR